MGTPATTLPPDFFDKQDKGKGEPPQTLPPDFFEKQAKQPNLEPRNIFESAADWITLGGTRKFREGVEQFHPGMSLEEGARGVRDITEGGMRALTPAALVAALGTVGAAPNVIQGLMAVAKPYLWGGLAATGASGVAELAGAGPEVSALTGELAGASTGIATGALRPRGPQVPKNLPKLPGPVKYLMRKIPLGDEILMAYEYVMKTGKLPEKPAPRPGLKPPKFGGAYEPEIEATPGRTIPRGKFEPPKATPGKGTGTPYGGRENPYGGPSYRATKAAPRTARSLTEPLPESRFEPPESEEVTADTTRVAGRLMKAGINRERWESATLKQKKDTLAMLKYVGGIGQKAFKDISKALE